MTYFCNIKRLAIAIAVGVVLSQELTRAAVVPVLAGQTDRPLRYRPVDHGFEIENGPSSFNRPLYGGYTAFRVDAGDRPEFSLYLPGRGGVIRVGVSTPTATLWLRDAKSVKARYADGAMQYDISDPALGTAVIRIDIVATRDREGAIIRATATGGPATLIFAYGGMNGDRSSRDGDIGTEKLPVSQHFALKPDHCKDNTIAWQAGGFTLTSKAGTVQGVVGGAKLATVDANQWEDAEKLVASADQKSERPAVLATFATDAGVPCHFGLFDLGKDEAASPMSADELANSFNRAAEQNRAVARQVIVDTPDPFIDSAASAMCLAADALWDDASGSIMHGGVAWRRPYLGWRGPYSGDAAGWHDRTRSHLSKYFAKQNTTPATQPTGADEKENLARSEAMLHTDGDLTNSHYDMNMVAVDTFFRHLLWTGDLDYARQQWPVIQRHLAWEKRLFRREFGPEKLPLYEAYACIWASDDLQYHGGGVAHSSAYNYYHNAMAARLAKLLGENPEPYDAEAKLILRAMNQLLWLPNQGSFAEFKDLLGNQLVHPAAALWTHYHTIDSQVPDLQQAWQMCKSVDTRIPHIPVRGQGVPGGLATLTSTTWMPYMWSINNTAMAEVTHTALADWQAGRADMAYSIFKGALVDSMFVGQCPGNLHMTSFFDVYRQEAQRDSGDPTGITWRALIEGLFGIRPDALGGELTIDPGFPADWNRASIQHPNVNFRYTGGNDQRFVIEPKFGRPMSLKLRAVVRSERVSRVTVNGKPAKFRVMDERIGDPHVEVLAPPAEKWDVLVSSDGDALRTLPIAPAIAAAGQPLDISTAARELLAFSDPASLLKSPTINGRTLRGTASESVEDGTVFLKVKQGDLTWWQPVSIDVRPAFSLTDPAFDAAKGKASFKLVNNTRNDLDAKAEVRLNGAAKAIRLQAGSLGTSGRFTFDAPAVLPGANRLVVTLPDDQSVSATLTVSDVVAKNTNWQPIDLAAFFNDRVTQIFRNKYLSPRSPYASLAMPTQGVGGWASNKGNPKIDDTGLRSAGPLMTLPTGVPLATPTDADAKNIAIVSRWDNYPRELTLPLTGKSAQATLLMAGSTNAMQSRFDNGEVVFTYTDGTTDRLPLRNPDTWWPIEQDYLVDDYGFRIDAPLPMRVDLKTGAVRQPTRQDLGKSARILDGGAATVLSLPLDANKELKSVTVRAIANEVVIGLMGLTLQRPAEVK